MIIPWERIPPDTLERLIEEYVTRDGTDYGTVETPLETRVEQVRLPYADAPDASARVMKCGLRILELNGLGDELRDVDACAADAEVEAAMQSEFTEASDASSSLDDLSDRNSPSSVMEIDSANWQGPDLRAGAHFFPDGKTRAY